MTQLIEDLMDPALADEPADLVDGFGRLHRDLRISLTDHCNLRCAYCMPADGVPWLPKTNLLTKDEIIKIAEVAVQAGVTEIRLTGGEPLLRPDLAELVSGLAQLEGPGGRPEISMTTNAIGLAKRAAELHEAGLSRVNISLDTLRPERFAAMTRRDRHAEVLAGIAEATRHFAPVKLNSVLMRGSNDDEAVELLDWALEQGAELRFIEQMPLDAGHVWRREGMVTADEIQAALAQAHELTPVPGRGAAPAERFLVDGGPASVGIIASVTRPFCGACDRLRLTADGQLRNCLFARNEIDLRTPLRAGASDSDITALIHESLLRKRAGHGINDPDFLQPARPMSAIGG